MLGKFISFEGGEGGGKSTQLRRLADRLRGLGKEIVETREPGGTPGAEVIRTLIVEGEQGRWDGRSEALLVNAARADHVTRLIQPSLDAGRWVLCDRYVHSTFAYQGAARGLDEDDLRALHRFSTGDLWPDLTLILDVPPETGLDRAAARRDGEARFEGEGRSFHDAVRDRLLAFGDEHNCVVINASADIDTVEQDIWAAVSAHFGLTP